MFTWCSNRNIVGVAIVAALTIVVDVEVGKVQRWFEWIRGGMTNDTVLGCGQMISRLADTDVAVMTGYTIVKYPGVTKNCPGKGSCTEVTDRTVLGVGSGRYVISRFGGNDYIVMAGRTIIGNTRVKIGTCGESTWCMTKAAILGGRHVVVRFAACANPMAGVAANRQHLREGMIDGEYGREAVGAMAASTIGGGCQVSGHRRRFGSCVNTIGFIVA